ERYESERRDNYNDVPRTTYGGRPFKIQVLLAAMKLTNDTQPQWMLGPANSRPQSVAIFFLATIFGQIVFPPFGARLLLAGSPSVQTMARSLGRSGPRWPLEYAPLNMLVMLGSMLSSAVDSAVWGFLRGDGEADG